MVRARDGPGAQIFEHTIHMFALDDLGLFGLFVESSEREGMALVRDGYVFMGIQGDGYGGVAHGIRGAVDLDLVDDLSELEGQVIGKDP